LYSKIEGTSEARGLTVDGKEFPAWKIGQISVTYDPGVFLEKHLIRERRYLLGN
jgi:hypothetical protein